MSMCRTSLLTSLSVGMLCCVLCGCSSPAGGSPQAVFEAAKQAIEKKDHRTYVACLTQESVDLIATGLVLSLHSTKSGLQHRQDPESEELIQRIDSILTRHDIRDLENKRLDGEMLADTIKAIGDRNAFVADAMTTIGELGDGSTISSRLGNTQLKNVRIDGDQATATLVAPEPESKDKKRNSSVEVSFRKEDGRWRIHLVRPEPKVTASKLQESNRN